MDPHRSRFRTANLLPGMGVLLLGGCLIFPAIGRATPAAKPAVAAGGARPDFVIILADDLGYGDIGCYGNRTIRTPRLDEMAREGIRFTDFHSNGPVCSPTRAALLTGEYQQRAGVPGVITAAGPAREEGLPLADVTFAEALKAHGYVTGMFGKWHLGYRPIFNPIHQGFDEFIGYVSGNIDYQSHVDQQGYADWWHADNLQVEPGYTTDLITARALSFIRRHQHQPFVLYLPHEAPHYPYQGRHSKADRTPGARAGTFPTHGSAKDKPAVYREMIEDLDQDIGKVIDLLRQLHLARKTFVFFCSDNGPTGPGSAGPLRGRKGSVWEGGHRVPAIAWWPGRIAPGRTSDATVMTMDLFPTLLQLAGVQPTTKLDGVSLVGLLLHDQPLPRRTLFWQYHGDAAVRDGDWKLVQLKSKPPALFNLRTDLGEQHDLASLHPDIVRRLEKKLTAWRADVTPAHRS